MLVSFVRTIILYILIIIVMRIMGKRQIGQLQPFELVVTLMLSELAVLPMQNTGIPLTNGIVPIITLLFLQMLSSYITMKSERARSIICGKPSIVIKNGKIVEDEIAKLQYGIDDLLEQLRSKNCANVSDVEFGILETNGQLSVILKSQKRPITPKDLNLPTNYEGIPFTLILDGKLNEHNLKLCKLNKQWLLNELKKQNIKGIQDVFYCNIDSNGQLFVQKYQAKGEVI